MLAAIPLGTVAATVRYQSPAQHGPFRAVACVQPFLLFLLPNVVLVGTMLFTLAVLARQVIPAYLGAIGPFIGYLIVLNFWSRIENPMLSALADPFGISATEDGPVLDDGRTEHPVRRLSRDAGVEPHRLARGSRRLSSRSSIAGSGSRTPTAAGAGAMDSEPSSIRGRSEPGLGRQQFRLD